MKNILVLTDFSERAKAAAEYAMNLAIDIKADLLLCHALEITDKLTYPLADHLILRNQTIKRLREVGMHLNQLNENSSKQQSFLPAITYLNDLDMLTEVAEKIIDIKNVDLVVIGSHRTNSLSRFFFGSHTNDILDNIDCPVLLIPEKAVYTPINHIAYATDFTFNNSKVINYLVNLSAPFKAKISVDHISLLDLPLSESEKQIENYILAQIRKNNVQLTYQTIKGDSVTKALLDISDSEMVDILTLVHKRYDFFEGLFHSSISKELAHNTRVPLLVMPYSFSLTTEELVHS